MDTSAHADTQTHRIHFCEKKKEKEGKKNTCRDENLSRTINSKKKFADTNLGIKKKTSNLSKQTPLYKSKVTLEETVLFSEDDVKRQKHVLKKNNLKTNALVDLLILKCIYIYIYIWY